MRLFELLGVHFGQSKGALLTDVRNQYGNLGKVASIELCKCYRAPEVSWGFGLEKDGVLIEDGQGLTDSQLIKSFMSRIIVGTYPVKSEIARQPGP